MVGQQKTLTVDLRNKSERIRRQTFKVNIIHDSQSSNSLFNGLSVPAGKSLEEPGSSIL